MKRTLIEILSDFRDQEAIYDMEATILRIEEAYNNQKLADKAMKAGQAAQDLRGSLANGGTIRFHHFKQVTDPVIKYLNEHHNPHCTIIITPTSAEVMSGEIAFKTEEHLID